MMKYVLASSGCPGPNNSPREIRCQHAGTSARGAMQDQDRLTVRVADSSVV
jgi:hypothetical protein